MTLEAPTHHCRGSPEWGRIAVVQVYEGSDVTITFDSARCIHARRCVPGRPEVFRPGVKGEWIAPDGAPADDILHIGRVCPSGAIRMTRRDGASSDSAPAVNTARLWENGPVAVEAAGFTAPG